MHRARTTPVRKSHATITIPIALQAWPSAAALAARSSLSRLRPAAWVTRDTRPGPWRARYACPGSIRSSPATPQPRLIVPSWLQQTDSPAGAPCGRPFSPHSIHHMQRENTHANYQTAFYRGLGYPAITQTEPHHPRSADTTTTEAETPAEGATPPAMPQASS